MPEKTVEERKLEILKKEHFTPAGREERIARARQALEQQEAIHLRPEEWKWVAEDPDLEEQFQ